MIIIKSFSPIKFRNKFISLHSNFSSGQHDSIEFIRIFLDDISRDTNKSSSDYKELILIGESKYELSNKYHNYYISRENSIITDIYYTQIINIFTCKCGKETSFEKLLDILLLIIENLKEIQLEELIHDYLKEISVNIEELCSNCKEKKMNIKKCIKFDIFNEIIIFSIQRIDPLSSAKNTSIIKYDDSIDLKRFTDDTNKDDIMVYKLFATIHHIGTISYGHYYSLICVEDQWYEFNDSNVTVVENISFNSSNVCALFYKQLKTN